MPFSEILPGQDETNGQVEGVRLHEPITFFWFYAGSTKYSIRRKHDLTDQCHPWKSVCILYKNLIFDAECFSNFDHFGLGHVHATTLLPIELKINGLVCFKL